METLRVDLLRLLGGSTDLARVTSWLGAAREVAADLERLLEGQAEVEEVTRDPSSGGGEEIASGPSGLRNKTDVAIR